jgi:hypothetical protein
MQSVNVDSGELPSRMLVIQAAKESFNRFDVRRLSRKELGNLHFRSLEPKIDFAEGLLRSLTETTLSALPNRRLASLAASARSLDQSLANVSEFTVDAAHPEQSSVVSRHKELCAEFEREFEQFVTAAWSPSLESRLRRGKLSDLEDQFELQLATARTLKNELVTRKEEAENLLDQLKAQAADVGTKTYARTFEELAEDFRKSSRLWMLATTGGALVLAYYGRWLLNQRLAATMDGAWYGQLAGRLIVLSAILFVLRWTSRNYRAAEHNEVVNRHRTVALKSFELFVGATKDADTKNGVLLRATEAIFHPAASGHQSGEAETAHHNTILEVVRRSGEGKS